MATNPQQPGTSQLPRAVRPEIVLYSDYSYFSIGLKVEGNRDRDGFLMSSLCVGFFFVSGEFSNGNNMNDFTTVIFNRGVERKNSDEMVLT